MNKTLVCVIFCIILSAKILSIWLLSLITFVYNNNNNNNNNNSSSNNNNNIAI